MNSISNRLKAPPELVIPPMTHPYGRYWEQPKREEMIIYAEGAVMTEATLRKLPQYDATDPTGAYEGKMWCRHNERHDVWFLCWFDTCGDPDKVTRREVRIFLMNE